MREEEPKVAVHRVVMELHGSQTRDMKVDLGEKLLTPQVLHRTLRLDEVPWSEKTKKIILIEIIPLLMGRRM